MLSEVPTDRSLLSAERLAQLLPNGEVIVGDAIKLHRVSLAECSKPDVDY